MYYGRHAIPISMLQTQCIDGCRSTISWSFEEGEPMTHDYPGYPDSFRPEQGCHRRHLDLLETPYNYDRREGELIRQLWQWEVITDGAMRSKWSSATYLGAKHRSLTNPKGWY